MAKDKVMLRYRQVGESKSEITLVFLHGSTMTKEGMLPIAEAFPMYNCIVFDLTAHGESSGEEPYEITTFAEDKGRVFLYPEQNLFDEYASEIGLTVLSSDEWLRQIGHIK